MRLIELLAQQNPDKDLPPFFAKCLHKPRHWHFSDEAAQKYFAELADEDLQLFYRLFTQLTAIELHMVAENLGEIIYQRSKKRTDFFYQLFGRDPEQLGNNQQDRLRAKLITK